MIYRALTAPGDYRLGKGLQGFLAGAPAVSQAIKTRLLLLQGEWWEDILDGLPLFNSIFGSPGTPENIAAIDLLVRDRISSTEGVASIVSFSSSYVGRQYSMTCTVKTISGQTATVGVSI